MSYETWVAVGYGTQVDHLKFSLKNLKNLISRSPEFEKELNEYFKESGITNPGLDDYLDYDNDYHGGVAYILKRTIDEAENIEMSYADDANGDWYLFYAPSYPWYTRSQEESCLTEKTVKEIIKKYVSILSKQTVYIGYQTIENGG